MDTTFAVTAPDLPPRRPRRPAPPRRGFTLVEMLTVIVIIGILASLVTGAVIAARRKARITVVALEISQFEAALKAYKAKYGEYPPDFSAINTAQGQAAVVRHLTKAFPRIDLRDPNDPSKSKFEVFAGWVDVNKLDPSSALVFWLGGLPDPDNPQKRIGFSANARNPFDGSLSRTQPLFEFDPERLRLDVDDVVRYYPDTGGSGENVPYVYFRPRNRSYAGKTYATPDGKQTVGPYLRTRIDPSTSNVVVVEWVNPTSFQIISAGMDAKYGTGSSFPTGMTAPPSPPLPEALQYSDGNFDNITNFSEGTLEDKM